MSVRDSRSIRASGNGCSQGMSNAGVSGAPGSSLGAPKPEGSARRARPSSAVRHALVAIRYSQVRTDAACGRTGRGPSTRATSVPAPILGVVERAQHPVAVRHQFTPVRLELHVPIMAYASAVQSHAALLDWEKSGSLAGLGYDRSGALSVCHRHHDPHQPGPTRDAALPADPPQPDQAHRPGLLLEVKRLCNLLTRLWRPVEHYLHWSSWQRHHHARARWYHLLVSPPGPTHIIRSRSTAALVDVARPHELSSARPRIERHRTPVTHRDARSAANKGALCGPPTPGATVRSVKPSRADAAAFGARVGGKPGDWRQQGWEFSWRRRHFRVERSPWPTT